jgi:hypothetical protein
MEGRQDGEHVSMIPDERYVLHLQDYCGFLRWSFDDFLMCASKVDGK